jgi:hypothetical protein
LRKYLNSNFCLVSDRVAVKNPASQNSGHDFVVPKFVKKNEKTATELCLRSPGWRHGVAIRGWPCPTLPRADCSRCRRAWTGVITTDGVSASWHCERPAPSKSQKKKKTKDQPTLCHQLRPRHYGSHGKDICFYIKNQIMYHYLVKCILIGDR